MTENEISRYIIKSAIKVHQQLGPGLLESTYQACLAHELISNGLILIKEKSLPVVYKGIKLDCGYRLDLFIENKVIIEIKSVETLAPIHTAQLLTYLKLSNTKLGFFLNFNEVLMKNGVRRIVNKL